MKKISSLSCVALISLVSGSVWAGTCTSPTTLSSNANITTGNSCNGDSSLGNICSNLQNTGQVDVYSWSTGASPAPSGNITVTPTGTAWNPALGVAHGADCATATSAICDATADAKGSGNTATEAETVALSGLNAGNTTYFLFITTFAPSPSCGTYNLTAGTLPVKLQAFSID